MATATATSPASSLRVSLIGDLVSGSLMPLSRLSTSSSVM